MVINLKKVIKNKQFDAERALYNLKNADVVGCIFAGPADGESALKETADINVRDCRFSLRYPLWHCTGFTLKNSQMDSLTRAPLWYSKNGKISGCTIDGVKTLRECSEITVHNSRINSPEFGWRCRDIEIEDSEINSEYFLFECQNVKINNLKMSGKYSFQYTDSLTVTNSVLDTKDAFWHSKNTTVRDSEVSGEYLGWYSDGLTLINCKISGTQPLCYCKNLTLIDCTMENTDLSFENSQVMAEIKGNIMSVKNPASGKISADSIGEIITDGAVMKTECEIVCRKSSAYTTV